MIAGILEGLVMMVKQSVSILCVQDEEYTVLDRRVVM